MDESCSHCGNMTIAMLRSRYLLTKRGGIPLAMPRSSSSGFRRATSAHGQGDLRITVRASPSSTSPRASHSSSASHHLVFPDVLMAKAYGAAGQAASALHAMALLQVHQAKALKQLHEGGADPGAGTAGIAHSDGPCPKGEKESGTARLRPCQAREAPGQAASLRRASRSLWILLFRRW